MRRAGLVLSRRRLLAIAAPAVVAGCVFTLDAVVQDSEVLLVPALVGAWRNTESGDQAIVSPRGDSAYAIAYTSNGSTDRFEARLGRIGTRTIVDIQVAPAEPEPFVSAHWVAVIETAGDTVRLMGLEPDSLRVASDAGRLDLRYTQVEDRTILGGSTATIRAALGPYLDRPGVLEPPSVWYRDHEAPPVPPAAEAPCFEAAPWREADQLFRRDSHWLGGDVASSVDLGNGRILWLFGDTFIDPTGAGTRQGAVMVSNSVAIQEGTDPVTAKIRFYWGRSGDGQPAPLFPQRGQEHLWFGSGVRVADRLVLFFQRTLKGVGTGLGFEAVGWTAVLIENPDAEPSAWQVRPLVTPDNPLGVVLGMAASFQHEGYVYVLGGGAVSLSSAPVYAARWPADLVRRGHLQDPEWWAGPRSGWVPDSSSAPRWPLFDPGSSEMTAHWDGRGQRWLAVKAQGFGPADLVMRASPAITGPWTAPRMIYRPPEYYRPNVMIYAGKAHPHLAGADLVLTYATNTFRTGEYLTDSLIYYPRFVRLSRCQ